MGILYTANFNASVTNTKNTLLQLTASSSVPIRITRVSLTSALTAATAQRVQLVRLGTGTTAMTAGTAVKLNLLSPTASTTVGTWVSTQTEGSTVTVLLERTLDLRAGAGFDYLPIPGSEIIVPVSGVFALYLPVVLAGTSALSGEVEWAESI